MRSGEAHDRRRRRALRRDRRAYRPLAQGQVHRPRRADREHRLVGQQPQAHAGAVPAAATTTSSPTRKGKQLFAQDLYGGADPKYRIKTRVYTELAWHSLFIRKLLIRPERAELDDFVPEFTIVDLPSFKADPKRHGVRTETVIAIDFTRKIVLIGGIVLCRRDEEVGVHRRSTIYLPAQGVMPMHCSANVGPAGDVALFFGLSGTGKTTLSADPEPHADRRRRARLVARTASSISRAAATPRRIKLSAEAEPEIYAATNRFGTVLENVVFDPETRVPDFDDESKTENTRSAYPLDFIPNASRTGRAGHPKNIVMLTADAFGVMPPIAKLTPAQAMYHFLSGYTAKVAGTEKGLVGVEPEFSTCFGAPFLPRHAVGLRQPAARAHRQARRRLLAGQLPAGPAASTASAGACRSR